MLVLDHCSTNGCSDICVNQQSTPTCLCRDGYSLATSSCVGKYSMIAIMVPINLLIKHV